MDLYQRDLRFSGARHAFSLKTASRDPDTINLLSVGTMLRRVEPHSAKFDSLQTDFNPLEDAISLPTTLADAIAIQENLTNLSSPFEATDVPSSSVGESWDSAEPLDSAAEDHIGANKRHLLSPRALDLDFAASRSTKTSSAAEMYSFW